MRYTITKFLNKPHIVFWTLIPVMILSCVLIDFNIREPIHIPTTYLSFIFALPMFLIGLIYFLLVKFGFELNKFLNGIHIISAIILVLPFLVQGIYYALAIDGMQLSDPIINKASLFYNAVLYAQLFFCMNILFAFKKKYFS